MCSEFFNVVIFTITRMEHHEIANLSFLHLKNQFLYIVLYMLWPMYGIWGHNTIHGP
jgi:hypothetical protein